MRRATIYILDWCYIKGKKNRTILAFHEQNFLTLKFCILFSSGIQKTFSAIFKNDFGVAVSQLYP